MVKIKYCLFLCILFSVLSNKLTAKDLDYVKNLGQWDWKINYKVDLKGGNLFLENNILPIFSTTVIRFISFMN